MEISPAIVDMQKKNHLILFFMLIVTTLGLPSALMPALDIDADGSSDSLITEGILLTSLFSASVTLLHLSIRFAPNRLASAWLLSFRLNLPPITTL
jgi:hypothetical protein